MADSEKLTALKKAYAEIILNTAKEAASRIMVSERKAQRYESELLAAKDEALHMLLRLKQILDSKVREAEMTYLNQQRRIDELEAQLGEAEDIVKDLRTELRELQDELEKVTTNQMQPLSGQNTKVDITTHVTALKEKRLSASEPAISSPPAAQSEPLVTLNVKDPTFDGIYDGNKRYAENVPHEDNFFVDSRDLASIMMRSKEPELYRNGCTQRIRAFEGNLLGGNLSLSGQANDGKNQIFIKEDEEDKHVYKVPPTMADNMYSMEKSSDKIRATQANRKCISVHDVNPFRKKRKRKWKKNRAHFKSLSYEAVHNNVQCMEESKTIDNIAQKDPEISTAAKSLSSINDMILQSGSAEVTKSDADLVSACTVQNPTEDDKLTMDEMELIGQKAGSAESSQFPAYKTNPEMANGLLLDTESKECDKGEALPTQPMNNKFLMYTFRRKRKKEFPSSPDGDSFLDDSNLKRKMGEKQSDSLESQKSSLITESSRDSRRLAQVARQLISLSEKKWW